MKHSAFFFFILTASLSAAAQTMPTVSSPEMPSFSSFPSVSQTSPASISTPEKSKAADNKKDETAASKNDQYLTAASLSDFTRVLSGNSNNTDIISSLLGKNNKTADDSAATNALLQQILTQLESMQREADEKPVNWITKASGKIWVVRDDIVGWLDNNYVFHSIKNLPLNSAISSMEEDYEGNLWFSSTRQGILKIVENKFSNITERNGLTEDDAHKYIQKCSMDSGTNMVESAKMVLSLF